MVEQWKPIKDYEGLYEVSDLGRVRSLDRTVKRGNQNVSVKSRILKPHSNSRGVKTLQLHKEGKQKTFKVHVLVATAFIGERPEGYHICHENGIASDNRLLNLRYDTINENKIDIYRYGRKAGNGKLSIEQVLEIRKLYATGNYSQLKLGEMFNVDGKAIFNVVHRNTFSYLNDDGTIDDSKTSVSASWLIKNMTAQQHMHAK